MLHLLYGSKIHEFLLKGCVCLHTIGKEDGIVGKHNISHTRAQVKVNSAKIYLRYQVQLDHFLVFVITSAFLKN
jgi:hypothetical protein